MNRNMKTMKYIALIISACNLCEVALGGISEGVSVDDFRDMVSRDPEILLTGEVNPSNNCTYVYTISKQKFEEILSSNIGFDPGCSKVDVNRIVNNCRDYAVKMNPGIGSPNILKLVSLEMFIKYVETNKVWYVRAGFTKEDCDWETAVRSGYSGTVVYSLLDGEVLKPRVTEYTRYMDQERKKFMQSQEQSYQDRSSVVR